MAVWALALPILNYLRWSSRIKVLFSIFLARTWLEKVEKLNVVMLLWIMVSRRPRQKKDRASCALGSDVTVKCAREIISSLSLFISISLFPLLVVPCSRRSPQLRLINLSLFFNEVDAERRAPRDKGETKREMLVSPIADWSLILSRDKSAWWKSPFRKTSW